MLRHSNFRPPELKSIRELAMMREAGKLVARAMGICREMAKPGASAIDLLPKRKWWSQIASEMQRHVEQSGFRVVTQYVGHGIGRVMHENPQVPNYVDKETRKHDFKLEPGLVLAVEPMVNMGRADV